MFYLALFAIASFTAVAVRHYAMRQRQRGFSLRGGEPPRRKLFADPADEAMRQWLESDDDAAPPNSGDQP